MPRGLRPIVLIAALSVLVSLACAGPSVAERVALVIGNADYSSNPLTNPVNDAEDMAARLEEIGFRVHGGGPLLEQDLRAMQVAIRDFTRSLNPGDLAVFYYAGHGVEYKGTNYLIPVDDEEIEFAEDVPDWSYPAPRLLERLAATGATGVIILDACRNNPLPERGGAREVGVGLTAMETPAGASAFIMYSAAPGQTSSDGDGRNGLFTEALLVALEDPARRIDDIMYEVSFSVRNSTEGRQVPWLEFAFAGEIPPQLQAGDGLADRNEVPEGLISEGSGKPGQGILAEGVPLYGMATLEGPPPPDGLRIPLLAGGYEDASQLGGPCEGFVASNPDFQLNVTDATGPIRLTTDSAAPTMLVAHGPDIGWLCSSLSAQGAPPAIALFPSAAGSYRVWVGTTQATAFAPDADLLIELAVAGGASTPPVMLTPEDRAQGRGESGESPVAPIPEIATEEIATEPVNDPVHEDVN